MDVKEIRRQTMLSQDAFAEELGIPVGTIRNWEQGRSKAPDYVKKLIEEVLRSRGYVIAQKRPDTVEDIRRIVCPLAKKAGVKKIVLFGSRARGDYDGKSDYDFMISKGKLKGLEFFGFVDELENAFSAKVDVVTPDSAYDYILEAIDREGVVIYES